MALPCHRKAGCHTVCPLGCSASQPPPVIHLKALQASGSWRHCVCTTVSLLLHSHLQAQGTQQGSPVHGHPILGDWEVQHGPKFTLQPTWLLLDTQAAILSKGCFADKHMPTTRCQIEAWNPGDHLILEQSDDNAVQPRSRDSCVGVRASHYLLQTRGYRLCYAGAHHSVSDSIVRGCPSHDLLPSAAAVLQGTTLAAGRGQDHAHALQVGCCVAATSTGFAATILTVLVCRQPRPGQSC